MSTHAIGSPPGLAELVARTACSQLVLASVRLVDDGSAGLVADLYTDDAELIRPTGRFRGRPAIAAMLSERERVGPATRHLVTNFDFELVDEDRASGTSVFMIFELDGRQPGDLVVPHRLARAADEFRVDRGVWRLSRREVGWLAW